MVKGDRFTMLLLSSMMALEYVHIVLLGYRAIDIHLLQVV